MYGDNRYASSSSGPPPPHAPPQYHYDGHNSQQPYPAYPSYSSHPPPPPPPARQWDERPPAPPGGSRDLYHPQERRDDPSSRGPYSGRRQSSSNGPPRDYRDDVHPPQSDFSFRVERPPVVDSWRPFDSYDSNYRSDNWDSATHHGDRQGDRSDSHRPRRQENGRPAAGGRDGYRGGRATRGRGGPNARGREKPHHRLLLSKKHDQGELMLGDRTGRVTYRDVDALSDSDEAAMDISDNSDSGIAEPANKRARTTAPATNPEDDIPRWSNPDPYTALPPPDESTRKKKDMVHLIRKARVEAETKPAVQPEAADFISCDFSDDDDRSKQMSRTTQHSGNDTGKGVPNAPTGPRAAPSTLPPKPVFNRERASSLPTSAPSGPAQLPKSAKQAGKKAVVDLTPSAALGNRKRTFDDQIKLPHASLKKATKMASGGNVVANWQPAAGEDPLPWATTDHSATRNMGTRLHKEIMDFYDFVRPREFEEHVRNEMLTKLEALVQRKWPDATIFPFGSFMSGLYLPTADMDIAICSKGYIDKGIPKYDRTKSLYILKAHLTNHKVAYRDEIELITKAKVPLVKYTDDETALKVDISFEKTDGYKAIQTFLDWKAKYPAMPILVSVIKHFLLMRGLNEPVNGGIGGFSVICMVVNLLHQNPQVQSRSMLPEHHLNELLMEFFDLYGNRFKFETTAIRMNPPGFVRKGEAGPMVYRNYDRLSIIDPNNPGNDIAGGSSNTPVILRHFSNAHKMLQERMSKLAKEDGPMASDQWKSTILGPLFAGRYSIFQTQRNYLGKLAKQGLPEYGAQEVEQVNW
ncbi:Uu.00g131330.m01.CDS01 [Anthostomella pinea]|uniref:polynucleotide adenylyltransferase n=1 Tax=Anthostomella pinea TaxID=933095 RepID=A0AAI8VJZ4_9PEZI|nr:Uu.00g131330.m01.CDS01 [Anthostomella pinea]